MIIHSSFFQPLRGTHDLQNFSEGDFLLHLNGSK